MPRFNTFPFNIGRACLVPAFVSMVFAPALFAGLVESAPLLPPANAIYTLPNTCISVVCLGNIQLENFVVTSSQIIAGNEVTKSDVDLTAFVFQDVSGSPGAFISPVSMTGQVDITYFSKSTLSELGTFNAQITSFNLSGSFTGLTGSHSIDAMLNPNQPSTGETTIVEIPGRPTTFGVTSFFDVFAELSVDGSPFVPGPERTADLTPEPAYYFPIAFGLAAIAILRFARTNRRVGVGQ